jgi:glutaminase
MDYASEAERDYHRNQAAAALLAEQDRLQEVANEAMRVAFDAKEKAIAATEEALKMRQTALNHRERSLDEQEKAIRAFKAIRALKMG